MKPTRKARFLSAVRHKRSWWLAYAGLTLIIAGILHNNTPALVINIFLATVGLLGFYDNLWSSRNRQCEKCQNPVFYSLGEIPNQPPADCPKPRDCGFAIQS